MSEGNTAQNQPVDIDRRKFLKLVGMSLGGVISGSYAVGRVLSGTPSNPTGYLTRNNVSFEFGTRLNAVEDLGMDNTGTDPVDDKIVFDDNTLIEFPPGTYRFEETHTVHDLNNWGIRGLGESREEVEFVTSSGERLDLFNIRSGTNILWENLTFNQGEEKEGAIGNTVKAQDGLVIRKIRHKGWTPDESGGGAKTLNVLIENPDGEGIIEDYDARFSGITNAEYPGNTLGVWAGPTHTGTLTFRNVKMEHDTGFYTSRTSGTVRFENCWFKNIVGEGIRVAGEGNYIRNCTFIMDSEDANIEGVIEKHMFMIPVRWESGFQGYSGGYIENCDFIARNNWGQNNSTIIRIDGDAGGMEIRDTRIECTAESTNVITAEAPGERGSIDGTPDQPWGIILDNVSIIDSGTTAYLRGDDDPVIWIDERPGSIIRNSCISSSTRDGVKFIDSDDCKIQDTAIEVGGQAVISDGSNVTQTNVSSTASCAAPDPTLPDSGDNPGSEPPSAGDSPAGSVAAACLKYFRSG